MNLSNYEKLGFKLFLCNDDKTPIGSWKDPKNHLTVEEAEKYQKEGRLIGAWIPSDVRVLDLDRHAGKPDGFKAFKEIAEKYNFPKDTILKTFTVKTAGNGLHLYFKDSKTSKKEVAPGIENRGAGGAHYVIAAGCPGYVPVNGATGIIEFPAEMLKWLEDAGKDDKPPKDKKKISGRITAKLLKEVLDEIDVFNFRGNGRWFPFMASCIAVAGEGEEILNLLEKWSQGDPSYASDRTIKSRLPTIKEDGTIGVGTFINVLKEEEIPDELMKKVRKALNQGLEMQAGLTFTDLGNGYAFIKDHGENVRYCTKFDDGRGSGWMYFDGKRWVQDYAQIIQGLAKQTITKMFEIAVETRDAALSKHAFKSGSNGKIIAMLSQAKSVNGIPIDPSGFDTDPWLLNVQNGTIDLRSGALLSFNKDNMLTKICNVEYDAKAPCPRWLLFIDEIMNGDKSMARFLQKLMGYCLTGDMREDMYFFLWGNGCNGKTVFAETILTILGDYGAAAMEETFMVKRQGGKNFDLERISDKRLIFTSELNRGAKLDESLIKRWAGKDTVSVEQKFQISYDVKPIGKLIFRTNSKPEIEGQDEGIWRRTKLIPFAVSFQGREDRQLMGKLAAEASGILNWMIEGCLLWQKEGLELPPPVQEASAEYRTEEDSLNDFMSTCLEKGDVTYTITKARCYEIYKKYTENLGEKVISQKSLGTKLQEYPGIKSGFTTDGKNRIWFGIRENAGWTKISDLLL